MDRAFLADLKQKCAESDKEFEQRMASRLEEISAVEETIEILNSDESFGVFEKTTKGFVEDKEFVEQSSAFFQTSAGGSHKGREATGVAARRSRASDLLKKVAGRTGS